MTDEEDTRSDEIADEDKRPATKQMAKRSKVSRKFVKKGDTAQPKDGGINTYCNVLETVRRIKGVLRKEELEVFRGTVFGKLLDVPEVRWISNGLLVGLLERYKLPKQGITGCKEMKFKIKGRKVLFTKPEFELIAGLGGRGNRITLNDERLGDFGLRYFNTGKSVQRCHITDALLQHNKDDPGVETDDVVKLALLHLLGNVMFGHESCVSFPIGYINLVDDLDAFDKFSWGEVIWEELLTHAGRCAQSLKARGRGRVTFGGFVFSLQVWAFEKFPSLRESGHCQIVKGREDWIPRCLRWEIYVKISAQFLHEAIFENPEFEVSKIVPSERELNDPSLALFASEYIRRGIDDTVQHIESLEKAATVARNLSVGSAKKRKLSTTRNAQNKPKEKRKRIIHSMKGEFLPKRKSKRKKESQSQIITILNDMKKMQESQGKVLKMILEQLERQKGDDTEERGFKKIDDEIVNENVESEDMENENMGKDTILEEDDTDHGYVGKDGCNTPTRMTQTRETADRCATELVSEFATFSKQF
ncbi:unnamed protein product [Cuscuta campestris]|uniref:DUF1985 domain-containing protein n=1 Tax=Cuscuta campestris TaxID=132261 RepID=A0A484KGD1_9ASTE|nr:unnamed protein product [Cuscuta campestris]